MQEAWLHQASEKGSGSVSRVGLLFAWATAALVVFLLFARITTYELQKDEQFYLAASVLFTPQTLYNQLDFSHFPNLPLLLHTLFVGLDTSHYVLVGRFVIFLAWIGSLVALVLFGRRYQLGVLATALLIVLLVFNPILLSQAGMTVTNNFIATPFILFGLLLFLPKPGHVAPSARACFAAGLLLAIAAGFKASYVLILLPVGMAALLAPLAMPYSMRVRQILVPLIAGGVIGGLPTLYFFGQDPSGFIAHCLHFHQGPQIAFWNAHPEPLDPKILGMREKIVLALQIWTSGATGLLLLLMLSVAALAILNGRARLEGEPKMRTLLSWPIVTVGGITLLSVAGSFLPTPSFPQYFSTPFAPAIVLVALLMSAIGPNARERLKPLFIASLAMAIISGGPMLLANAPKISQFTHWTGIAVHKDAEKIGQIVRHSGNTGPVATLLPIYPLEAGLPIYPHLSLGQFIYRASDYIPPDQRGHFDYLVSPGTIGTVLASTPPSAVLVSGVNDLEDPLARFAQNARYVGEPISLREAEEAMAPTLFVPAPSETGVQLPTTTEGLGPR
jgi:hypothetical protein